MNILWWSAVFLAFHTDGSVTQTAYQQPDGTTQAGCYASLGQIKWAPNVSNATIAGAGVQSSQSVAAWCLPNIPTGVIVYRPTPTPIVVSP